MKCNCCSELLPISEMGQLFLKCQACGSVYRSCGDNGDQHIVPCQTKWCPICGIEVVPSLPSNAGAFVWRGLDKSKKKMGWSDPVRLEIGKVTSVFPLVFDAYVILIGSNGQFVVYQGKDELIRSVLVDGSGKNLNDNARINKVLYSSQYIVFSTNGSHLYYSSFSALFNNGEITRIDNSVTQFDFDPATNRVAYSTHNSIKVLDFVGNQDQVVFSGDILHLVLRGQYLMYITSTDKLCIIIHSFRDNRSSSKSITFSSTLETILSTANSKYLAVSLTKGSTCKLVSGSWRHVAASSNNWIMADSSAPVNMMCLDNDDLLYIQNQETIERKEVLSPTAAVRNTTRKIPDMIPNSLFISLDGRHISVCKRDTAVRGYNSTKVVVLSDDLTQEFNASLGTDACIAQYIWINGLLVAIVSNNGDHYLVTEVSSESE